MCFDVKIAKLELKAGDVGFHRPVVGLCKGAGELKTSLGRTRIVYPAFKPLQTLPQGELGALNPQASGWTAYNAKLL